MKTAIQWLSGISALAVFLSMSSGLQAAPVEIDISGVKKAKDKVTAEIQGERAVFNVVSSDGIGSFTATLKSGQWPREVSVIVNRKILENFGFETDRIKATGVVKPAAKVECSFEFRNSDGKFDGESTAGSLRIMVKETKDGMALILPSNLFTDTKQFSFGWIDAYR